MSSLEVVLGLVVIILFYSLLATILMELISGFFAMRAKHLEKVLRSLLSPGDRKEEIFEDFKKSVLYQQLSGRPLGKKTPPSYLEASTFRSILLQVMANRNTGISIVDKIEGLPDNDLKELLNQFWEESGQQLHVFSEKIEHWYEDVMDRASGWYKRNTQKVLLFLGVLIAVVFNVDTIAVYKNLVASSKVDMEQLVGLAESLNQQNIYVLPSDSTTSIVEGERVDRETVQFISRELENLKDPLGIGWENVTPTKDIFFWFLKVFGWLVTAICISKGAPFWFDLLRKIVDFRNTGKLSAEKTTTLTPEAVTYRTQAHQLPAPQRGGDADEIIEKPVG